MDGQYEVLSPWADAAPIPLRGISPRVTDLTGKTVGLYAMISKVASRPILTVVEQKLKERFPTMKFSWFLHDRYLLGGFDETENKVRLGEWLKGVDTVIAAVGD